MLVFTQVESTGNEVAVTTIDERLKAVESKFGVTLRGHQSQTLKALAAGKSVILHAPTGGGD